MKNSINQFKRFSNRKDIYDEDKVELLYGIETWLKLTWQDRITVNDIKARFMKDKKENFMVAYNIYAWDYDTKLNQSINITQNPTDHYELQNIAERVIRNITPPPNQSI